MPQLTRFQHLLTTTRTKLLGLSKVLYTFECCPNSKLYLNCAFLTQAETQELKLDPTRIHTKFDTTPQKQRYLARKFLTHHVLRLDKEELLGRMIDRGFPLNYIDGKDPTNLLFSILKQKSLKCLNLWLERGYRVSTPSLGGVYPLIFAAQFAKNPKSAQIVQRLIRSDI